MMSEEMKNQQVEMLIRFYNMQAGTSFRVGKPENRSAVNSAIERANGDIVKVKNAVREWVNNHNDDMQSGGAVIVCFDTILCECAIGYEGSVKSKLPAMFKEMFGSNAVFVSGEELLQKGGKGEEYLKEVFTKCEKNIKA